MTMKITMILQAGTTDANGNPFRVGGKSESVYKSWTMDRSDLTDLINRLCTKRARLLPTNVQIVAVRLQMMTGTLATRLYENFYPGTAGENGDLPQVCFSVHLRSNNGLNHREYMLNAVPDDRVKNGEPSLNTTYRTRLRDYFLEMATDGVMKCRDRSQSAYPIAGISAEGILTTKVDTTLVAGDRIILLRAQDLHRIPTKGEYLISAKVGARTHTLDGFVARGGHPIIRGRVRKVGEVFLPIDVSSRETDNPTATTFKWGRPYFSFRGRRSASR